jgi:hypothetical protein
MELVFIISLLVSINCLNIPEFIGKSSSKGKNKPYNTTKFNRFNTTKKKESMDANC